jgi:hypothetical protein
MHPHWTGTGNDLARALGWGGGLTGSASEPLALHILGDVAKSERTPFDLWRVQVQPAAPRPGVLARFNLRRAGPGGVPLALGAPAPASAPAPEPKFMVNYLCVGCVGVRGVCVSGGGGNVAPRARVALGAAGRH